MIDDLIDTLYDSGNGIGLAANQIGILRRIFVIDLQDGKGFGFCQSGNYRARRSANHRRRLSELARPWGYVERPAKLKIKAQDREGETFELEADGLLAVCIAHENDHLDGILFKDKIIPADKLPEELVKHA